MFEVKYSGHSKKITTVYFPTHELAKKAEIISNY